MIQRLIIWSIIGTGVSSISVQLLTIREFLSQFRGNEITISLVLFCWLFLTGIGSLLARLSKRPTPTAYALLNVFIATWPLLQILVIRAFRDRVFVHGTAPDFYAIFFYIMSATFIFYVLLWISVFGGAPHPTHFLAYCFASSFFCGYQFPTATRMIGEERSPAAGCLAADLARAAVGTLLTGALLIPVWGMKAAIILLILIKISSNIIILLGKRGLS